MTRATHRIEGRRNTPPNRRHDRRAFVVGNQPDTGSEFEGHANEFAFDFPGDWGFRPPLRGERIEFDRQGSLELREWNGRRWRKVEDSTAIDDVPANATRTELSTAVNAMLAAMRKADVIDDLAGSSFAPGGE